MNLLCSQLSIFRRKSSEEVYSAHCTDVNNNTKRVDNSDNDLKMPTQLLAVEKPTSSVSCLHHYCGFTLIASSLHDYSLLLEYGQQRE